MATATRTVAVIGATGATGQLVVNRLLERDAHVIAVGRSGEKLRDMHGSKKGVELRVADVFDGASVRKAMAGADSVITATGYVMGAGDAPYAATATSVVAAMRHHGIKRLVFMGSSGVLQPEDRPSTATLALFWIARYVLCAGTILDDQEAAFRTVLRAADDIHWIYVRPGMLLDGPGGKEIVSGTMGVDLTLNSIDRADVAAYMVEQALGDSEAMVHTADCIAPRA